MAMGEKTKSVWMDTKVAPDAPRLAETLTCDTVIVGSGIAGLSTAYELASAGQKVVVLDRGPIAGGMTARTTAHLAPVCDDGISTLLGLRGEETTRLFQESQAAAVDRIEAIVRELGIDCDFRRVNAFLFPAVDMEADEAKKEQDEECEAAGKVGVTVERVTGVPLKGFETAPVLRYPNQATFHPLRYLAGLVKAIEEKGGRIFAHTIVTAAEETGEKGSRRVRVETKDGGVVEAAHAVFATNAPVNDRVAIHSKMAPYRTYAVAFALPPGALPDALYWDMADPYHYVRLQPKGDGTSTLIVGGEDHKSGEADDGEERFQAVVDWIRPLVPSLGEIVHRWSGQVMETVDHCAFIGRNPGNDRIFVACGDSGQGMTHGALAGLLLRDLILEGKSRWEDVYEPSRKPPSGVLNYVSENMTAVKNFAEYLLPGEVKSADELKPGEGGVLRDGLKLIAACRDLEGRLHLHSAACTHLGCVVHWNSTEQCWDCPCHGSHFAPDGTVLNGPAIEPLAGEGAEEVRERKRQEA